MVVLVIKPPGSGRLARHHKILRVTRNPISKHSHQGARRRRQWRFVSNTNGSDNTAVGFQALTNNSTGIKNTAVGSEALQNNTIGVYNTATGFDALSSNTIGFSNTATGIEALFSNLAGTSNTAIGFDALYSNIDGDLNTASGYNALHSNTTGDRNTASGSDALSRNTTGRDNTAIGQTALTLNTTGIQNTASGNSALQQNTTGNNNIAIGYIAGSNLRTGNYNIDVGNNGVSGESNTIRIGTAGTQTATFIAGIRGTPITGGIPVGVTSSGQLGVAPSSQRFKEAIKPMDKASEAILALKPVTFRYKKEIDPEATPQFGLVAEDVEKVNPDLVVRNPNGKPYTVRYDAVNAMLLNEFLKEHRHVQEQQATIAQLKKEVETVVAQSKEQDSKIQKVSAQIELNRPAPQIVLSNP